MQLHIVLCASCRMALGKLRRTTNIAAALKQREPRAVLTLMVDSGKDGIDRALAENELAIFDSVASCPAGEMASRIKSHTVDIVVVDTMKIKDLHQVDARLCLVLREVLEQEQKKFRLSNGRFWDLIILPHPAGHWEPNPETVGGRVIRPAGWIYRAPNPLLNRQRNEIRTVLITTGGGSGEDQGNDMHSAMAGFIAGLRATLKVPVQILQVVGPRDRNQKKFDGVDGMIQPGPELHQLFASADLVISAAGYNTVLELAATDVPVLLTPIPRYSDDQEKRAHQWSKHLGMCYSPQNQQECMAWMAKVLSERLRRPVADLGPSGADAAADAILALHHIERLK